MKDKETLDLITVDTETRGFKKGLRLISWAAKYEGILKGEVTQNPKDFFQWLMQRQSKDNKLILTCHNLTFDIRYLDQAYFEIYGKNLLKLESPRTIIANGKTYRVALNDINAEFKDSLRILPMSLKKLSQTFKVEHPKIDIEQHAEKLGYSSIGDYLENAVIDSDYIDYSRNDVLSLFEIISQYIQKLSDITGIPIQDVQQIVLKKPTTPSITIELFKRMCTYDYNKYCGMKEMTKKGKTSLVPVKLFDEVHSIVRESIHGGRTEKFMDKIENGYVYDVNSLYPYVMNANNYPVGKAIHFTDETAKQQIQGILHQEDEVRFLGICKVKVEVPYMDYPVLGTRMYNKYIFPYGTFWWTGTTEELRYAMSYGAKIIEVKDLVWWKEKYPVYRNYIHVWSEVKETASQIHDDVMKLIAKNNMNMLFGKSIQNPDLQSFYVKKPADKEYTEYKYREETYYRYNHTVHTEYYQPQVGAYVTSYARMLLHRAIMDAAKNGAQIAYCDTDSIVTNKPLSTEIVHPDKVGLWKLEKELKRGIFIEPKMYYLELKNSDIIRKGKGFSQDTLKKMYYESYAEILENTKQGKDTHIESLEKPTSFMEWFTSGNFVKTVEKSVRGKIVQKREMLEDGNSRPLYYESEGKENDV